MNYAHTPDSASRPLGSLAPRYLHTPISAFGDQPLRVIQCVLLTLGARDFNRHDFQWEYSMIERYSMI